MLWIVLSLSNALCLPSKLTPSLFLSLPHSQANRPGGELVAAMGGLHSFIGWPRGMLTDSGGFQMVSLLHLAEITEEGVTFQSPVDGSRMLLTPEESIAIQNNLGADIAMQLDDVVPATTTGARAGVGGLVEVAGLQGAAGV